MLSFLKSYKKKTITIKELAKVYNKKMPVLWSNNEKQDFIAILDKLKSDEIIQIKSNKNGYYDFENKVIINHHKIDSPKIDLDFNLFSQNLNLDPSYYLKNPLEYNKHIKYIKNIVDFLEKDQKDLTINEISYIIFEDEKALLQPDKSSVQGKAILKNLNLSIDRLNPIDTISPFYFMINNDGDSILIVENKETCFSIFRLLAGKNTNIKGIIYGEGRAVVKIFGFINTYGLTNVYKYLYYGDLDQEGFDIALSLINKYYNYNICLSKVLYNKLLEQKSRPLNQKRNISFDGFTNILNDLSPEDQNKINLILEKDHCIPQEALNFNKLKEVFDGLQNRLY